jgi:hypothetical protein
MTASFAILDVTFIADVDVLVADWSWGDLS